MNDNLTPEQRRLAVASGQIENPELPEHDGPESRSGVTDQWQQVQHHDGRLELIGPHDEVPDGAYVNTTPAP